MILQTFSERQKLFVMSVRPILSMNNAFQHTYLGWKILVLRMPKIQILYKLGNLLQTKQAENLGKDNFE